MLTHPRILRRWAAVGSCVLLTGFALTACTTPTPEPSPGPSGASSGSPTPNEAEVGVTLIVKTTANPFFVTMQEGAKVAASEHGVRLSLAAGTRDGDEKTQITAIKDAVARGDKGILITPNGPDVLAAIKDARAAGVYVIALDTVPIPRSAVDITFATNNREAGNLIGQWTAGALGGGRATIALLDLFNDPDQVVSLDYERDQGFLAGLGVETEDAKLNGDERKSGQYVGAGDGGPYVIVGNEPALGTEAGGEAAMKKLLRKNKNINVVYTINEPVAYGAYRALQAAGKRKQDVIIVSIDGGCEGVKHIQDGVLDATSQQYPLVMAEKGVEAIKSLVTTGHKPEESDGLDFFDTGTALVTDAPVSGVKSITAGEGLERCWGQG